MLHAAAYNLQAIDLVNVDFMDIAALDQDARKSAEMGFTGKQIIHPKQLGPVQEAFTPSNKAIEDAQTLVAAAAQYQQNGSGVFVVAGKMVGMSAVTLAERLLERARAAGKIQ